MTTEIGTRMPMNLEAERAVLGSSILSNEAALESFSLLQEDDFFMPENRIIFRRILHLSAQGKTADLVTLTEGLSSGGELDRAGGPAYIAQLVDGLPSGRSVSNYAEIIRRKARLRKLIHFADTLQREALDTADDDTDDLIESTVSKALSIAADASGPVLARPWAEVAGSAIAEIERGFRNPDEAKRINFGISDLDDFTSGLRRKELVSIVAPTSNGKTQLAGQCVFQSRS